MQGRGGWGVDQGRNLEGVGRLWEGNTNIGMGAETCNGRMSEHQLPGIG